ncbi:PREDICTED: tubulin-folding cofactor E-like [Camelina sativa]|uniref:Tubulin-folding cofactor E-like n=1 Tax=Camelina sativa TaxID=90675 RepID=A0ABM0TL36_CAMSA|nr:PREDICTED: tubulin-folding cofactor E-like [Camelina sativa]
MNVESSNESFKIGQRVHSLNDSRRVGTVKYVGGVEGYSGTWIGVDWDQDGDGKHNGSVNGVFYFNGRSQTSASFVRSQNLSSGITLLQALELRYRTASTKDEEDEMYVLSAGNKGVSIQLLGGDKIQDKLSRFEELTSASLSYLGVSSLGVSPELGSILPNLKLLDLTGNLISDWEEIGALCEQLPALTTLNLSSNSLSSEVTSLPQLNNIRVLVLNNSGVSWNQVENLRRSLPGIEELHLMGNMISSITSMSSSDDQAFNSLELLNLDDNCISDWSEVLKLAQLPCLEQLYLNKNKLSRIFHSVNSNESPKKSSDPFPSLRCLLLGANNIDDLASIDALNVFPKLVDIRLSDNPITDPARGGVPRFVLIARLTKVQVLNGSEVRAREKKDSEIRYVRMVMTKPTDKSEIELLHPRFDELKKRHGIEDERASTKSSGPKNMASGLISITLKCVGPSMGEKPELTKKLPGSITVGKMKILCENFFKLKNVKPRLFLQEEGSPFPTALDEETSTLLDVGICEGSTLLIDEES